MKRTNNSTNSSTPKKARSEEKKDHLVIEDLNLETKKPAINLAKKCYTCDDPHNNATDCLSCGEIVCTKCTFQNKYCMFCDETNPSSSSSSSSESKEESGEGEGACFGCSGTLRAGYIHECEMCNKDMCYLCVDEIDGVEYCPACAKEEREDDSSKSSSSKEEESSDDGSDTHCANCCPDCVKAREEEEEEKAKLATQHDTKV